MNRRKICLFRLLIIISFSNMGFSQTKLISYNIKNDYQKEGENNWESRKSKLIRLLNHYQPSIFGIQEGLLNQVEDIDNGLVDFNYIGVGRDNGKQKGEYCAIFYNTKVYKVIKDSTFWLSETPDKVSVAWDAALQRICTYGLFENLKTKQRIWILNTHFDHVGKIARENSARLILKHIQQINKENLPLIFMGDLNAVPKQKAIQILKAELNDGLEMSETPLYGPIGTFNGFTDKVVERRIDYFFTLNLKVLSYEHIDDRLNSNKHVSDHFPILITIDF